MGRADKDHTPCAILLRSRQTMRLFRYLALIVASAHVQADGVHHDGAMTPTECKESAPDGEQCSLIEQRCWCRAIIQDGKPEKEHTSKAHKKELKEKRIKKHKKKRKNKARKQRKERKLAEGKTPKLERPALKEKAKQAKDEARAQHKADKKAAKPKNQPDEGSGSSENGSGDNTE